MVGWLLFRYKTTLVVPPRISPFFFENGVMEGMRTQLMCSTSEGDQPFNITWLMDDEPIHVKDSGGEHNVMRNTANNIHISDYSPFSSILTINSVTAKHSGNYTCQIKNVAGIVEHTAALFVFGLSCLITKDLINTQYILSRIALRKLFLSIGIINSF